MTSSRSASSEPLHDPRDDNIANSRNSRAGVSMGSKNTPGLRTGTVRNRSYVRQYCPSNKEFHMHADLTWQRTIDRQTDLRRQARCWRLCVRRADLDPAQIIRAQR